MHMWPFTCHLYLLSRQEVFDVHFCPFFMLLLMFFIVLVIVFRMESILQHIYNVGLVAHQFSPFYNSIFPGLYPYMSRPHDIFFSSQQNFFWQIHKLCAGMFQNKMPKEGWNVRQWLEVTSLRLLQFESGCFHNSPNIILRTYGVTHTNTWKFTHIFQTILTRNIELI